jgi:hypothetical protein
MTAMPLSMLEVGPMIRSYSAALACLSLAALLLAPMPAASARECKQLASSVNDYGKEGPSRDAQKLLDAYAKRWTAEHGIKTYTMGEKTVTCELFLDFGFFDEHTCKAQADVCWGGGTTGAAAAMVHSAAGKKPANPLKPAVAARPAPHAPMPRPQ